MWFHSIRIESRLNPPRQVDWPTGSDRDRIEKKHQCEQDSIWIESGSEPSVNTPIDQLLRLCSSCSDLSSEQMLTVVNSNLQTSYKYICKTCQDDLNTWERLKVAAMTKEEQIIGKMNALQTSHLANTTGICRPPAALPCNLIPK